MSLYRYRAKDRKGHKYKGIREGENEVQLVKSLAEDGLYCYFLQNEDRVVSMRHFTVPLKWLPPFCSQVSSMLSSGVPQSDILKTACKTAPTREMKVLLARLEEKIHRGQTLSEAMGSMGKCFPKLLIYMIQTGEASGTLDDILQKMSVYYAKEVEMEGKVRTAMIYPFILLLASIGASVFLLTTVLPQFADILEEYELPAITRFMMAAGEHLQKDWILYCLWIPVVFLVFALLSAVPKLRLRVDGLFFHIPVIAGLLKTIYTSRFASTFSVLYGGGNGIIDCMAITGRVMGNTWVERKIQEAVNGLEKGESLSAALKRQRIFHPVFLSMVAAGEESGELESVLLQAGVYYGKAAEQSAQRLVTLIEPCMILVMAGIVGTIVLSIMLPVFNMYSALL